MNEFVQVQRERIAEMRRVARLDTRNGDGSPWSFRAILAAKADALERWLDAEEPHFHEH